LVLRSLGFVPRHRGTTTQHIELRPHTSLNHLKIGRSTKDSRQAECIIRCSMLDVRCSTFISFFSLNEQIKMIRVTAAILVHNDRILIAQRGETDDLAGKWEFPGGKIENNESPQQCLIRELQEEFGIDAAVGDFFGESTYHYETGAVQLLAYHTSWEGGSFSLNAHAAIRWVSLNQLQEFEFAPADIPLVEKLQQSMTPT